MTRMFILLLGITIFGSPSLAQTQNLQTGDLIFHMSQSRQAAAIQEAQGSPYTHMGVVIKENGKWYVYEAIQPVKKTLLTSWIARGKNKHFVLKRIHKEIVDFSKKENQAKLISEMDKYAGLDYDIFFEWSDDRIYCSELAYKAIESAFGVTVGQLQKVGDLDLSGPNIKKLIKEREKQMGRPVDLEEPIITPVSVMHDQNLEVIATYSR